MNKETIMNKLGSIANSPPNVCSSEECVLQWVIHETQVAQSYYDTAQDMKLSTEDFDEVEDLYKYKLGEILNVALSSLGVLEI